VDDDRWQQFIKKQQAIETEQQRLDKIWVSPANPDMVNTFSDLGESLTKDASLLQLLKRPEVNYQKLMELPCVDDLGLPSEVTEQVEIQAKYHGYIVRQQEEIDRNLRDEDTRLPQDIDYKNVRGLSNEITQKLNAQRPYSLGHAARIPGMTPAAISVLRIHIKKSSYTFKQSA
jgi:tRNA uridine 5-carboxymethylaminomethyl modification enzyme